MTTRSKIVWAVVGALVLLLSILAGIFNEHDGITTGLNIFGVVGAAAGAAFAAFLAYQSAQSSSQTAKDARRAYLKHYTPRVSAWVGPFSVQDHTYQPGDTLRAWFSIDTEGVDPRHVVVHWQGSPSGQVRSITLNDAPLLDPSSKLHVISFDGVQVTGIRPGAGVEVDGGAPIASFHRIWVTVGWMDADWVADVRLSTGTYPMEFEPVL